MERYVARIQYDFLSRISSSFVFKISRFRSKSKTKSKSVNSRYIQSITQIFSPSPSNSRIIYTRRNITFTLFETDTNSFQFSTNTRGTKSDATQSRRRTLRDDDDLFSRRPFAPSWRRGTRRERRNGRQLFSRERSERREGRRSILIPIIASFSDCN